VVEPGIETRGVEHIRSKNLKAQNEVCTTKEMVHNDPVFIIHAIELPKT
jgi:hypothetical protein